MNFGYFTLSDNNYRDNPRSPNAFVRDIVAEALHAEALGMHSAWIGEHHFSTLGVNSCPEILLTHIAAKTTHIRLAPAVTVLPLHHPIRVAEQWATLDLLSGGRVDFATGRGYDRREYAPFQANFEDNSALFAEGLEIVQRLWTADGLVSHRGKYYAFDDIWITPTHRQAVADRRYAQEQGRGGRLRRGDPLLQSRPQAARAGQGRDGPLHAGGGACLRGHA